MSVPIDAELFARWGDRGLTFKAVYERLADGAEAIVEIADGDPPYVRFGVDGLPMIACMAGAREVAAIFEAYGVLPGLVGLLREAADILLQPKVSVQ